MKDNLRNVIIVSRDVAFSAACAKELEAVLDSVHAEIVTSPEEARAFAHAVPPEVILLDESSPPRPVAESPLEFRDLEAVVTRLAALAPVIVLAAPERHSQLAALIAVGAADFVARSGEFRSVALSLLERRLRTLCHPALAAAPSVSGTGTLPQHLREDFGEVLRHELNNPLTGILGNAELLLAELRRRPDGRLPQGAQRRLEIITDLAVRLRETVRQLSEQWETRHDHAPSG